MSISIKTGLMALALLGSTALTAVTAQAADKEISWIYCGDTIDPVHTKYIKQWEEKNTGWKVAPEVVGWAQCQDKATTLAAAGTPVAMAYVGSRTLKEFAQNDLIVPVPMTDDEKKTYYPNIVNTVTFEGTQWGVPIAFSTKALYWNKDLFKQAGLDPETPPKTWAEEIEMAKTIKEKTGIPGFGLRQDLRQHDAPVHALGLHQQRHGDRCRRQGHARQPGDSRRAEGLQGHRPLLRRRPDRLRAERSPRHLPRRQSGMIQAGSGAADRLKATKISWGITTLPLGPDAKGPGTLLITDSLAIFKGSGVEDKATEFAKFITSPDVQSEYELQGGAGLTPLRPSPRSMNSSPRIRTGSL